MPITRLGVLQPSANDASVLASFTAPYLVSVLVANTSLTAVPTLTVDIWVAPQGVTEASEFSYIAKNLGVGVGQSFETFRFAVSNGDALYVEASSAAANFTVTGIEQEDAVGVEDLAQTFANKVIRGNYNVLYLEKGTTAERPADVEIGYARFNTELDKLEIKTSQGWAFAGAGIDGSTGPEGPQGIVGPAGPQGATGAQATAVTLKSSVTLIEDLPSSGNTLNDGRYVVETETIYGWTGSAWTDLGPIQGVQGPQGPQGEVGATGLDSTVPGPTGPTGPTGSQGITGPTGPSVTSMVAAAVVTTTTDINSSFTVRTADANGVLRSIAASAITVTIPDVLLDGQKCDVIQSGNGQVTFAAGSGVSLVSKDSKNRTNGVLSRVIIQNINGTYHMFGDLI